MANASDFLKKLAEKKAENESKAHRGKVQASSFLENKAANETARHINNAPELISQLTADISDLQNALPTKRDSYYSRPNDVDISGAEDAQSRIESLSWTMQYSEEKLKSDERKVRTAASTLQNSTAELMKAYTAHKDSPTRETAIAHNQALANYKKATQEYEGTYEAYLKTVEEVKKIAEGAQQLYGAWNQYISDYQNIYDNWRSSIRDPAVVKQEMDEIDAKISHLQQEGKGYKTGIGFFDDAVDWVLETIGATEIADWRTGQYEINNLQTHKALLQEEYDWGRLAQVTDIRDMPYFGTLSQDDRTMMIDISEINNMSKEDRENWEHWYWSRRNGGPELEAWAEAYGIDRLEELNNSWDRYKNAEYVQKLQEDAAKAADGVWGGIWTSVAARAANLWSAVTSPLSVAQAILKYDDRYSSLDPNSPGFHTGIWADAAQNKVTQNIMGDVYDENGNLVSDGGVWRDALATLYSAGMSASDSLARLALGMATGGGSTVTLGLAAMGTFGDTVQQISAQGGNPVQAIGLGILKAGLEVLTEKYSVENLFKVFKGDPLNGTKILKEMLKQGAIEVTEEEINFVASTLAEAAIMQERSAYSLRVKELVNSGKSETEAREIANMELIREAGNTAIQSFLSGMMTTGATSAIQNVQYSSLGGKLGLKNVTLEQAQEIVNSGLESDKDTTAYQMAVKLQKKLDAGKIPTAGELYQQLAANEQAIQEEQKNGVADETGNIATGTPTMSAETNILQELTSDELTEIRQGADNALQAGAISQEDYNDLMQRINRQEQALAAVEPTAEPAQIQQEQNQNGGTQHANTYEEYAGAAVTRSTREPQLPSGGSVLYGSGQWNAGAGAVEQVGGLGGGTGPTAQRGDQSHQNRIKTAIARQNLARSLGIQKVSSTEIGLINGTENQNLRVLPQEQWDSELQSLAQKIYAETGKEAVFVVGEIYVRGEDGRARRVRAAITETQIILRADYDQVPLEQILDHEIYHYKADFVREGSYDLNDMILEHFSEEELRAVLDKYIDALAGQFGLSEELTEDEYKAILNKILEELFADAYAGINAFGAGADRFTETVNKRMDQIGLGKQNAQENGTEQPTGPPSEENKNTAEFGGERYSVSESFAAELQNWFDQTTHTERQRSGIRFLVGTTTDTLKSIGVKEYNIYFGGSKIDKILTENPSMSLDTIKQAVMLLEDPILIMESATVADSIVLFGEVYTSGNKPVMISLLLNPKTKSGEVLDYAVITSAYGRRVSNLQHLIDHSKIYYVNDNKNRTEQWLKALGLQLPSAITKFGSIDSISDSERNVKHKGTSTQRTLHAAVNGSKNATANGSSSTDSIRDPDENVNRKKMETEKRDARIAEILESVSTNHALQFERYTRLTKEDPELAAKEGEELSRGIYGTQFDEYRELTELGDQETAVAGQERFSMDDADYIDAVADGDLETAQKMVDEAAKAAGYDRRMFHETDAENIHVFDISRGDHGATDYETPYGIFTKTSDKNIGLGSKQMALFVKAQNTLYVNDRADVLNKIPGFVQYYDQIQAIDQKYNALAEQYEDAEFDALQEWMEENPDVDMDTVFPSSYIVEGKPADIDYEPYLEAHRKYMENKKAWEEAYSEVAVRAKTFITEYLRSNKYDSMYFAVDGGSRGRQTDSLIVLDQNQVKSADPVTYDNKGNVIPLSERFNSKSKDIRYSMDDSEINAIQSVGRTSVNAFGTTEIQKTERLAQQYWNEMGVKSPFFRAWFGDWRENDQTPVQIADRLGNARGVQRNTDTGWDIQVSGKVFAESGHFANRNKTAVPYLHYINDIVQKAVLLDSYGIDVSGAKSQNSLLMHSMYTVADIGNGPELLKLYVEEMNNPNAEATSKRAYQLQNIEKASAVNGGVQSNAPSSLAITTNAIRNVADLFAAVKVKDSNFSPKPASKVVNADGTPMVMYHGSPAQFTVFDKKKAKSNGQYGRGFYFTNSQSHAGTYGQQYSVYLNIRNPLEYGRDTVSRTQVQKFLEAVAENEDYSIENYGSYDVGAILNTVMGQSKTIDAFQIIQDINATAIGDMVEAAELFNAINGTKFDGIVVPTETVAFYPNQIKSATDNIGTFDGSNPNIRYSMDDAEDVSKSDAQVTVDNAKEELIKALQQMTPAQMMGNGVRQLIDQYTTKQAPKEQTPKVKVDRGNLRKALTSTLGLTKEQSEKLTEALDKYTEATMPKRNKSAKVELDVESRPTEAKNILRKKMLNLFSVPAGQRGALGAYIDGFADRIVKNGALTEEDRKAFFSRMYEAGAMTIPADEYYAEARSFVTGSHIYVSDSVVADLGDDWQDIRRRAFAAGIYLTRSRTDKNGHSVSGIDVWNNDLAAEMPGLFDAEDTDRRTILEKIIRVAEAGKDEQISLAEYVARVAKEEYTSENEVLDSMERQMLWHLETFAETAQVEIQLKERNLRRVMKERQENKERAQRAKEGKDLRELQQRTLKQLQWLNRNRYRAPEELQSAWNEVLGDIDLYAVGAANEMNWSDKYQATWKDLAQMYEDARETDPNFLPSEELQKIVGRLKAKKIADMDIGALSDLYKAAVGLRTEFYNRNNVINDEMQRLFAEVYTDSKREIEAAPGGFSGNKADKFFNMDQLTPMNVLQRMAGWNPDSAFYSMAKQLERGERDMRAYAVKAQRMLQDFLLEHADWVKIADGQGKNAIWYEVEVPELLELHMGDKPIFGDTIKVYMTPAQKVHMYLESKNQDNLRHMTGGRTFVNKELYSKGKRQEALAQGLTIRLAPETVKQLVSDLTPEEMELARILDLYYNTFATQEINRVSNVLYGYDKAMGKHYAPIYTNKNYTKSEFGVFDVTAEGVGNLKGRQHAVNPSYNISAFDAFERHVDQTSRFVGMAIPARNWTTLMNWREKNNSTADVITHKWGEMGKKYITDLITTLQGGNETQTDTVSSGLAKLQSNYISAVFGANPSIVLKQLGSIPLAGAYLGAKNLPSPAQVATIDRDFIAKYTQDLAWRMMGYTTPETKQLKENPNWTQTNKFYRFTFGGGAITAMDGWAASILWPWAENKVRNEHPDLATGTQEEIDRGDSPFYKKVAEEFENALSRSQSVSDEIHQGTLRKSKNPITRTFTLFRSDSAQTYNALRQKIGEAKYYARTGANSKMKKSANGAVGTAFMAMTLNAVWAEVVTFLMALWKHKDNKYRDDEDNLAFSSVAGEMITNMLDSFAGIVTGGEEVLETIGNLLTGEKIYDIETPGMEQLNDMIGAISDAGGTMREIITGAADILNNGGDLGKYFSKHSGKILGGIKEVVMAAATYVPGIPVNNLEAYLIGALKWVSPELGAAYDDLFSDKKKWGLSSAKGGELQQKTVDLLRDRGISGSEETAGALAKLYAAGYTGAVPSDIPSSVSINGEEHTLNITQQQFYEDVWSDIVSRELDGVVASERFADASPEIQEAMLQKLYTYAADQAKASMFDDYKSGKTKEEIAAYKEAGLDAVDYFAVKAEGHNADKYLKAVINGLSENEADDLMDDIEELEPMDGKDSVADVQRWRVCVDSFGVSAAQLAALASYMTDTQLKKAQAADDFGVDLSDFVRLYEIRTEYDENENGSFSSAEYKKAIDSLNLDTNDSAVLWQLFTGAKSAKNNPYSSTIGQKVLDSMDD